MTVEPVESLVRAGVGVIDRSDRVRLEVMGPDRARFLHNLTTNEVKRLATGQGCEAFVTSLQGKTLGFVTLHVLDDRILLRSDPGSLARMLPHLQKYGALDDVSWVDVSAQTCELHLAGPRVPALASALDIAVPDGPDLSHALGAIAGQSVRLIREAPAGVPGQTLVASASDAQAIRDALVAAGEPFGLVAIDPQTFDAMRIEAGTPVYGRDITGENLPQELARDAHAISFVKGCYLGQETVARLDALGHVNKILRGGLVEGDASAVPAPGTGLLSDGKPAGTITSSAFSAARGRPVVLAIVRVAHAKADTRLTFEAAGRQHTVIITDLPMPLDL